MSERTGGAVRRSHTGIEAHSGQPYRGPAVETVARSLDGQGGTARSASAETTAVPTRGRPSVLPEPVPSRPRIPTVAP